MTTAIAYAPHRIYADVQQFYATQALLLDRGLHDEDTLWRWARTFVEDGSFWINFAPKPAVGWEQIVNAITASTQHVRERNILRRHWFSMLAVYPQQDGTLRTRYYALVIATEPGGMPRIDASTVTLDTLVHIDGTLRTRSRRVLRDDLPS